MNEIPEMVDIQKLYPVQNWLSLLPSLTIKAVQDVFKSSRSLKLLRRSQRSQGVDRIPLTNTERTLDLPYTVYRDEADRLYAVDESKGLIGKGGFSRVKLAQELSSGTWVAVKIHKIMLKKVAVDIPRIEQEIEFETAAGLYLGKSIFRREKDIKHYTFKKYIFGCLLSELLKKNEIIHSDQKVAIAIKIVEAVLAWHQKGFLHGDIKPKNIILAPCGTALNLIDFGISAKSEKSSDLIAHLAKKLGTKNFMAPEYQEGSILNGNRRYVMTEKTDTYATGVTLGKVFNLTNASTEPLLQSRLPELLAHLCHADPNRRMPLQASLIELNAIRQTLNSQY